MVKDSQYGVAVRLSNPEETETRSGHTRDNMEHFITLPRNGKNRVKEKLHNHNLWSIKHQS